MGGKKTSVRKNGWNGVQMNCRLNTLAVMRSQVVSSVIHPRRLLCFDGNIPSTGHSPLFQSGIFGTRDGKTFREGEKPMKVIIAEWKGRNSE
ncbi:hypothetical protein AVEN_70962-1 [Araneus ventricosus]|uniref:Uncharacterized protein n=1 Tax=Araneus ventricosus TaxID=182803 RepID=A0A4Y2CRL7_ARAVE|nr:hypothetical protein AVEN_70962-1 [Araneus ventricosus]